MTTFARAVIGAEPTSDRLDGVHGATAAVLIVLLGGSLLITVWASRRSRTTTEFWAAGRTISAGRNGLAMGGDVASAATFLGFGGLIYYFGVDGFLMAVISMGGYLVMQILLADRMRNAGEFTSTDVVAHRFPGQGARAAMATSNFVVATTSLVAEFVGGSVLLNAVTGVPFPLAIATIGGVMLVYVIVGGMAGTTVIQMVKMTLMLAAGVALTVGVLARFDLNILAVFARAAEASPLGPAYPRPGNFLRSPADLISTALAFVLGIAALPHALMRFFTVPDAQTARASLTRATLVVCSFMAMVMVIGNGARALLGSHAGVDAGGTLALPLLAQTLGGGVGTVGGTAFLAIVVAVALASSMAVVSGLIISAAGAVAHDIWAGAIRGERLAAGEEVLAARLAVVAIGVVAAVLTLLIGRDLNVAFLVSLALAIAASASLPVLVLSLGWRRFTAAGAVCGVTVGLVSAMTLIVLSPAVWPGVTPPVPLSNPALVSVPLGFAACWLGTTLSRRRASPEAFARTYVRSQTGIGSATSDSSLPAGHLPGSTP